MLETFLLSENRWLPCQGSKHHINFKSYSNVYSLILEETFQILTRFLIDSFKTWGLQILFDNIQSIAVVWCIPVTLSKKGSSGSTLSFINVTYSVHHLMYIGVSKYKRTKSWIIWLFYVMHCVYVFSEMKKYLYIKD